MDFDIRSGTEAKESELPALEQLVAMGYLYLTRSEINKTRIDYRNVLLYDRLEQAIRRLNSDFDDDGIHDAVDQISEDRFPYTLDPVETNETIRAKLIELSKSGGVEPIVVTQNFGDGPVQKVVKIFDFDNPENNDFVVTNQFQLEGLKNPIFLDIVIFVNGIPLVLIECKSPAIPDPIGEAVDRKNFYKYQQRGKGYEKLFFYNHCLIATCGTLARVGTLNSNVSYYSRWANPYPLSINKVKRLCNEKAREQEILIAGLLTKENLLNHMQNFVLYDTINNNRIKMIAKHQQYRAVSECVNRLKSDDKIADKGGVIWHTQGSGKSFSMLWFASQLMYKFGNPPIMIITDRKQLDKQIHDTFKKCGFPSPIRAKNAQHLVELLQNPRGKTIMTVIDKFATKHNAYTDERVICLVDEAHRSHFKINAEQMRVSMPNAIFYGFTGTPIDKNDKSTVRVFGPIIDRYGFKESQEDGATLPIRYQGRLPELFVEGGETMDELFERIIGRDLTINEELKDELKRQCVTKGKIAEAPSRIKLISSDLVKHYTTHIEPNGYKAMLVAPSREAAVLYKKNLDKLNAPPSKIIMTSDLGEKGKDGQSWDKYYLSSEQREQEAEKFKSANDPTKILIVVDMLLVGYDVPICQVLYLDKGIKEHNLLQAIARVNRFYDEPKTHGLVVDYSGITKELQTALEIFGNDIDGALYPFDDLLRILKDKHADVVTFFKNIDRDDNDSIIEYFEPADRRDKFEQAFKLFSKSLNSIMPDKEAEPYMDDFKFLSKTRQIIRTYYEGVKPSTRPYARKIQKLIDEHIRSLNISELINPMEITYENFVPFVKKNVKNKRAQTALIKNKAVLVIEELRGNNPVYYEKLWERLQKIIEDEENRRRENAQYFTHPEIYEKIYDEALGEEKERQKIFGNYNATQFEFALYGEFNEIKNKKEKSINLAKRIRSEFQKIIVVDWRNNISVEKRMKCVLYDTLSSEEFEDEKIEELTEKILILVKSGL